MSSWSIWGTGMDEAWWSQYRRFICLVTVIGRGWSPSTTILAMYLWRNIRVFFRCLGYARLNTKYVQKAEMIPSSIPELRNTSMWSTFRMFGALLAKAIFQSRSVNWIVGYGLSRSVYSKPKGKKAKLTRHSYHLVKNINTSQILVTNEKLIHSDILHLLFKEECEAVVHW